MAGMAADSAFMKESLTQMQVGQSRAVGPYTLTLKGVSEVPGPNWSALDAEIIVQKGSSSPYTIHPQSRTFTDPPMETSESAITTAWNGQLYVVVGAPTEETGWPIRIWWKPFVTFIWLGGFMIALGGFLSLLGRVDRDLFKFIRRAKA
jgi:cytochrome c-type biogenesis protein CcmF